MSICPAAPTYDIRLRLGHRRGVAVRRLAPPLVRKLSLLVGAVRQHGPRCYLDNGATYRGQTSMQFRVRPVTKAGEGDFSQVVTLLVK